jgi:pimeloyl-ACP methyl ester carboxylesterase
MFKIEEKFIQQSGLKIKTISFGSNLAGTAMFVLHGWNTTGCENWKNFINQFRSQVDAQKICLYALDLPGFGQSQSPDTIWGVEQYAEFVDQFISNNILDSKQKVIILGHSFGGAVATFLTAKSVQNKIEYLFLAAPAIVRVSKSDKQNIIQGITKFAKKLVKNQKLKKIWYRLIGSPDYVTTQGIMQDIFRKVISQDLVYILPEIHTPTTIFWGDQDKYTPLWQSQIVHENIANSELLVLPGINHGLHLYAYEKLYSIVSHKLTLDTVKNVL